MNDPFGRPQSHTDSAPAAHEEPDGSAVGALGVLLVVLGGLVALVGFFLPLFASPDGRVEIHDNYAFWYDPGGFAFGLALGAPVMAVARWRRAPLPWWIPTTFGAIGLLGTALVLLVIAALSLHDLTWSGPATPESDALDPGVGPIAIGIGYVATLLGGILMRRLPPLPAKAAAAELPPEGWYPDPESDDERWWDGRRWGEQRRPLPAARAAAAPGVPLAAPEAEPGAPPARERPVGQWDPPAPPRTLWSRPEE